MGRERLMGALLQTINFNYLTNWSVAHLLESQFNYNQAYELVKIGDFLTRNKTQVIIQDNIEYKRVTIKMNNNGIYLRDKKNGKEIGTKKQFTIKQGQFLLSKIDARNGAFGVVTNEVDGGIITGNFWTFDVDYSKINPHFLSLITTTKQFQKFSQSASSGTTGRHYLNEQRFLDVKIPLPSLEKQKEIIASIKLYESKLLELQDEHQVLLKIFNNNIFPNIDKKTNILEFTKFLNLNNWSVAHLLENKFNYNKAYELVRIGDFLIRNKNRITIDDNTEYKRVTIRMNNNGIALRDRVMGKDIGTKKQFLIEKGQFLLSKIDARNGAFGLATDEVDGAIITADFFAYEIDTRKIEPYFLVLMTTTKQFQRFAQGASSGTTGRQRIDEKKFLDVKIPLPTLNEQKNLIQDIVKNMYEQKMTLIEIKKAQNEFEKEIFNEA